MAKKRQSPLQQMLSGQVSHVAPKSITPQSKSPLSSVIYGSNSSSKPVGTTKPAAPRGPAPSWRPSYFKPTPSLARTVQLLSQGVIQEQNYDLSANLGQMLETRYDIYRDRLDARFDNQRAKYEHALNIASIYAKDDEHKDKVQIPEMPKVPGLGRGMGEVGLNKALEAALRNVSDPDVAENISRYYRYEKERIQSIKNANRSQRASLRNMTRDFNFDIEEAIARGDTSEDKLIREGQAVGKKEAPLFGDVDGNGKIEPIVYPKGHPLYRPEASGDEPGKDDDGGGFLDTVSAPYKFINDAVGKGLEKIGGEAKDPLFWALDKLSRPLYGFNEGAKSLLEQNKDGANPLDEFFGLGAGPLSSLDEFADDPLGVTAAVWKGWGRGVSGKDKSTGRDYMAYLAAHDNVKDVRDTTQYQTWVGLGTDLIMDPLNFVGVGIAKKPMDAIKAGNAANDLRKTSEGVANVVANSQHAASPVGHLADPDKVYRLLTANVTKRPHNVAQQRENVYEVNQNVDYLMNILQTADINMDTRKMVTIEGLGKALADRREALVEQFGDDVLSESIRSGVRNSVQAGKSSPDDLVRMEEVLDTLESDEIVHLLTPANERAQKLDKIAEEEFGTSSSWDYVDEGQAHGDWTRTNIENMDEVGDETLKPTDVKLEKTEGLTGEELKRAEARNRDKLAQYQAHNETAAINKGTKRKKRFVNIAGHTTEARGRRKRTAWDNVVGDPDRIAEILRDAGPDFKQSLPSRLRDDPRLDDFDWDQARRRAYSMTLNTKVGEDNTKRIYRLNEEIAKKRRAVGKATGPLQERLTRELEGLTARRDILVGRRDRQQAATIIKLARSHLEKSAGRTIYRNPEAAAHIIDELDEINRRMVGHEDEMHLTEHTTVRTDDGGERSVSVAERKAELESELRSLEGITAESSKRLSLQDAPEAFVKEGKLNTEELANVVRFDPTQKLFRIKPGHKPSKWLESYRSVLQQNYERHWDSLRTQGPMRKISSEAPKGQKWPSKLQVKYNAAIAETSKRAQAAAIKDTEEAFEANRLFETIYNESIDLMAPKQPVEKAVVSEIKSKQSAERAGLLEDKRIATMAGAKEEVARIDAELGELRAKHAEERLIAEQAVKQAREAKKVMQQRMREEALFRAASIAAAPDRTHLAIKMMGGGDLVLPGSGAMLAKGKAINGLRIIKGARQFYADAFKSPASALSPQGQLIRARAVAHTPNIIEHHINKLRNTLGNIREKDRIRIFDNMIAHGYTADKGVDPEYDAIKEAFDDLIPYFRNEVPVGDGPLTKVDINRYLPEGYRINPNAKIGSMQDLVKAVRSNKANSKYDRKLYKDPYRMSWVMRVAVEQAQARRGMEHMIGQSFGIKRGAVINKTSGKAVKGTSSQKEFYETIEKFKDLGWQTIPRLGYKHYFPPEIVPEINKLLDMMEPENIGRFGEMVDKATRGWKAMTTIYNPGYWTRNGVGEVMSSWFAGVNNPLAYTHWASSVIKFARKDGQEIDDLAQHLPGINMKTQAVNGDKVLYRTGKGEEVTPAKLWMAYQKQGLKTGFVNTEFESNFSKAGTAMRDTGGLDKIVKGNDKLRSAGEWYEDYLRMAHFADAIKRHGGTFEEAAFDAAHEVRKYHFDYTDFTNFEKMTMLRAFPFYKWTRKAAPLMMTMLFTKPGKVMVYPKVMNAISTQDIARDDNGFAPNYEGIVPGWIQDMWAYKIAEGGDDEESFFNLATPQMDAYKSIVSPGSTAYGLLNPVFKAPIEQGQEFVGMNLSGAMKHLDFTNNTDMNIELNTNDDKEAGNRISQLMRTTPQGNILQKMGLGRGEINMPDKHDSGSFLTGLGFYRNDEARRRGELMNQGMSEKEANAKLRELYGD